MNLYPYISSNCAVTTDTWPVDLAFVSSYNWDNRDTRADDWHDWWMMDDEIWTMNDEDERLMMNNERWTMNDEWWTMNDERWTMNDERWKMNDERWTMNDEWWMMMLPHIFSNRWHTFYSSYCAVNDDI